MEKNTNSEAAETVQTTDSSAVVHERLVSGSFAPRPWHINKKNPWLIYAADGYGVASVRTYHWMHPDIDADARLIAAAPDMLEALLNLENDDGSIPAHAWELCQAAISKAFSSANA